MLDVKFGILSIVIFLQFKDRIEIYSNINDALTLLNSITYEPSMMSFEFNNRSILLIYQHKVTCYDLKTLEEQFNSNINIAGFKKSNNERAK